jgi:hypothetical protein
MSTISTPVSEGRVWEIESKSYFLFLDPISKAKEPNPIIENADGSGMRRIWK